MTNGTATNTDSFGLSTFGNVRNDFSHRNATFAATGSQHPARQENQNKSIRKNIAPLSLSLSAAAAALSVEAATAARPLEWEAREGRIRERRDSETELEWRL